MTKKKSARLTLAELWAGFDRFPDRFPLHLEDVAGMFGRSPETLVAHASAGLPPPLRDMTDTLGPGKHGGKKLGAFLGDIRKLLTDAYEGGAPAIAQPSLGATGSGADRPLMDKRSAEESDRVFAAAAAITLGGRRTPRKVAKAASFAQFLEHTWIPDDGTDGEEWLFRLVGPHRRPVDFFETLSDAEELESGVIVRPARPEEEVVIWMTLDEYLKNVRRAADDAFRSNRSDERTARNAAKPAVVHPAGSAINRSRSRS